MSPPNKTKANILSKKKNSTISSRNQQCFHLCPHLPQSSFFVLNDALGSFQEALFCSRFWSLPNSHDFSTFLNFSMNFLYFLWNSSNFPCYFLICLLKYADGVLMRSTAAKPGTLRSGLSLWNAKSSPSSRL